METSAKVPWQFRPETTHLFLGCPRDILVAVSKFQMVFDTGNPSWASQKPFMISVGESVDRRCF